MSELKCPHCGQAFTVDDAELGILIKQIRDKEFDKEISERLKEVRDHLSKEHELELEAKEQSIKLETKESYEKVIENLKKENQELNEKMLKAMQGLNVAKEKEEAAIVVAVKKVEDEKNDDENLEKLFENNTDSKKTNDLKTNFKQIRELLTFDIAQSGYVVDSATDGEEGLKKGIEEIKKLRKEFWENVCVPGTQYEFNQELEKALRLADFLEIGELMARDALGRNESCGGHFRVESQTEEGEAKRDDANYMYVAAWEYKGEDQEPELHKEPLKYEFIEVKTRNYKD